MGGNNLWRRLAVTLKLLEVGQCGQEELGVFMVMTQTGKGTHVLPGYQHD